MASDVAAARSVIRGPLCRWALQVLEECEAGGKDGEKNQGE
jgi:hypothetical protein